MLAALSRFGSQSPDLMQDLKIGQADCHRMAPYGFHLEQL